MTDSLPPGRLVWSLPHVRSAVLNLLPPEQLLQLLTLSSESFPEVVELLYRNLDRDKWPKFLTSQSGHLSYPCLVS